MNAQILLAQTHGGWLHKNGMVSRLWPQGTGWESRTAPATVNGERKDTATGGDAGKDSFAQ